jgi:hypothetical protein
VLLKGQFLALPVTDPLDGERVVCYRSFLPAANGAGVSQVSQQVSKQQAGVSMKITIQGQDYTAALDAARPLTIERKLNEPSICQLWLSLPANGSLVTPDAQPVSGGNGDDGTVTLRVTSR